MRSLQLIDLAFRLSTLTVFLSSPTTAVASRTHDNQSHSSPQDLQAPVSPLRMEIQRIPQSRTTDIHKRMRDGNDDLIVRHIQVLTAMIPIWDAAQVLEVFYRSIFDHAVVSWADIPLSTHLMINYGCLELTMTVTNTDVNFPRGIPWGFVRDWSWNMLCVTRLGFVGTYRMWYASIFGVLNPSLGIEVCLRINWQRLGCHIQ